MDVNLRVCMCIGRGHDSKSARSMPCPDRCFRRSDASNAGRVIDGVIDALTGTDTEVSTNTHASTGAVRVVGMV
jgi:hypothetical protein